MKECTAFPKVLALLQPQHQFASFHIQDTSFVLTSLQRSSRCILQAQPTGHSWGEVSPLCRDAVGVFYRPKTGYDTGGSTCAHSYTQKIQTLTVAETHTQFCTQIYRNTHRQMYIWTYNEHISLSCRYKKTLTDWYILKINQSIELINQINQSIELINQINQSNFTL